MPSTLDRLRARYHYWLGLAWRSRGNTTPSEAAYHDAIGALTQAILYNPDLAEAHFVRGVLYWRELTDYARAVRDLSRAIELKPNFADAYLNRGLARVYGRIGTRDEMLADFNRYLDLGKNGYWRIEARNYIKRLEERAEPSSEERAHDEPS